MAEQPPHQGALAQVKLTLPNEKRTVEGVLRVMRVKRAKGGYEIGTQIVHMTQQDRRRFRVFLKKLKKGEMLHFVPEEKPRPSASRRRTSARRAKSA